MKKLIDVTNKKARKHFLKGSSYFNSDLPKYISFEPILGSVDKILNGKKYSGFTSKNPRDFSNVNYELIANKDGKLAWRPFEIMHPVLYVSLVNEICSKTNWELIVDRFKEFKNGVVDCCSDVVVSTSKNSDKAQQISSWWQQVEQKSLQLSLEYSHLLHTDVVDCYGSLYTHSIPWALHGKGVAKNNKRTPLIGNVIDSHIQAGRFGQTNGISQGSVLMDFIAEIVLGYVDEQISCELSDNHDFRILRYRDDYRVFTNSDDRAEEVLKVISDKLREVGMKLGTSKTYLCPNVIEGSIKPDKLAGINLQDLGKSNAKTIQKQLLRLHQFGKKHPNSGALRRLLAELLKKISKLKSKPKDVEVLVAIAVDIAFVSPVTFPAIAGILSQLISRVSKDKKEKLWGLIYKKMSRMPNNGYLEIWLQRVIVPNDLDYKFSSTEAICNIVDGQQFDLWNIDWLSSNELKTALASKNIVIDTAKNISEVIDPKEIELFKANAWSY